MANLYSDKIRSVVQEQMAFKPYPTLKFAIAEYSNMLTIRLFESNIMTFSEQQYHIILEYIENLRKKIESFNVKCEIEGIADVSNV